MTSHRRLSSPVVVCLCRRKTLFHRMSLPSNVDLICIKCKSALYQNENYYADLNILPWVYSVTGEMPLNELV